MHFSHLKKGDEHEFESSQLIWETIIVQFVNDTSLVWKCETCTAHTLRVELSAMWETSCLTSEIRNAFLMREKEYM